jgi:glycosyltransferase involved in cell wall biosynthesis
MNPAVSVIMPTYNPPNVELSVAGVLSQTHNNLELIIIDDCSDDETIQELTRIAGLDDRIVLITNEKNRGAGVCRNIGLRAATSEFIAFCDADDVWLQSKLEIQLAEMIKERAPICCSAYVKKHHSTNKKSAPIVPPKRISHNDLLKSCSIAMSTAVVNKNITGYFEMPRTRRRQDFGMWLQLTSEGNWALGLNNSLVEYCYGHKSVSSNKLLAAYYHWKTVREHSNIPLLVMLRNFFLYAIHGIRKFLLR